MAKDLSMDVNRQVALIARKVNAMLTAGIPRTTIATELLAHAIAIIIKCPLEMGREQSLVFWNHVIDGISKEVDAARKSEASNVIPLHPDTV